MLALEGQQGAFTNDQVNGMIRNEVRRQKQLCHTEWEAESRGVEWDRVNGREAPVVQARNSWPIVSITLRPPSINPTPETRGMSPF